MKLQEKIKKDFIIIMFFTFTINSLAQTPTLGTIHYDTTTSEGYMLFTPEKNQNVYLINNCGEKLNEWTFSERPGLTCYILDNGDLLRVSRGEGVEIRDWDNNIVWSFSFSDIGMTQHHDIEPLPNGNILCLMRDNYTKDEIIALGKNPDQVGDLFKLDSIIEIEPVGTNGANIVWEWKFIDHFIQDFDSGKPNFGVVVDHPELIDLNFFDAGVNNLNTDFTHGNAIDYNASLDQIIISARHLSEIYIIDHSTTTAEASSHLGGNSGLGGDFLWRWGNPQVYKQGDATDQKLFLQHDSKWVEDGYLDEGKISVFNNGGDGTTTFSSVHLITPDIVNDVYLKEIKKFKPLNFEWSWDGGFFGSTIYETKKSGGHSLPNGNFIICETSTGQVSEITKSGDHLWSYRNPTGTDGIVYDQFDTDIVDNTIFRGEKYPIDYIGFTGKNLVPQGIIENENLISINCNTSLSIIDDEMLNFNIINPVDQNRGIVFNKIVKLDYITVFDLNGRVIYEEESFEGSRLNLNLSSSLYFIKFQRDKSIGYRKILVK
jgi:hypothetical protein